jgi:hypothetical protein
MGELCKYVGTLWVQDHGSLFRPLSEAVNLTTDILWWYKPSLYGGLCPICFSRDLGFGGSIFVF